jgi:RNA polymerase sigma-70 factor, ECF subfamily
MQTAQETETFQRQRAEVPHSAVAIALTPAQAIEVAAGPTAHEDERDAEIGALVERAQAGDKGSLDALLAALRPRAIAAAMRIMKNADDAEDAVQDAFVKIWKSFEGFEGRSSFSTWVHRIVLNASLDLLRRGGARHETHAPARAEERDENVVETELSSERTPESDVAEHELQIMVRSAIARLPLLHRQAVELRELEDYSYQEMADVIKCPIGTVMSRLHHARHRLAEDLSQPFADSFAQAAA